ncbi:MAG: phenylacetate--CoA ligase family protein [Bacteroidales bacterium]|nr:phenylacetate--CoA ligase family protein [Bacteroidales bacterium]
MSLYNVLDRHVLLPLGDLFYGSEITRQWRKLRCSEFRPYQEILEFQNEKLRKLIKHCYVSVPYYHKLFDSLGIRPDDIQNKEDLCKLPVLTKQIIRDNYSDMFSTAVNPKRFRKSSTGGSTGTPLQFCMDSHEWSFQRASSLRAWESYGLHLGDKIFSFGGNSIAQKKDALSLKNIYDRVIMRNYKFNSSEVDENSLMCHLESFKRIKPSAVRGYGSSLAIFARFIKGTGYKPSGIKVVLTTGEVLMPNYRKELEDVFAAPVFDAYGAGDGGIVSHECDCHNGLHITEELCIIEITDKEGKNLPDGEMGFVTSTDLENYAFPFIRYHVGDMSYIKKEACTCGRHTRQFGEVMGRAGKLLYNKQGVPLSPTMLPIMLYPNLDYHSIENQIEYNKIDRFQIRQDKQGDIHILLKMKDGLSDIPIRDSIIENYQKHFVGSKVELTIVDEIPLLASGKEDYCVSEYKYIHS